MNIIYDNDGRYIILEIERYGLKYTVGNVYVPTRNFEKEQRDVFARFIKHIDELENEHVIVGGDYNLYLKPKLDKLDDMGDHGENMSFRIDVESFLETNNMSDVWRTLHPDKRVFTWHRGNKRARLDYFFIAEHLLNCVDKADILPGIQSDHSLSRVCFSTRRTNVRGRGFWKFNATLLHDKHYVDENKNLISGP